MAILPQYSISNDPISQLKGVGPQKIQILNQNNIYTINDLLNILPRHYQLRSKQSIKELIDGENALIVATVLRVQYLGVNKFRRLEIIVKDESAAIRLIFFSPKIINVKQRFVENSLITILGTVSNYNNLKQITHPRTFSGDVSNTLKGLWPVYSEIKGIYPALLIKFIHEAIKHIEKKLITDWVSEELQKAANMLSITQAYKQIHTPSSEDRQLLLEPYEHPAFRRLAFEEILSLQLQMQKRRQQITSCRAHPFSISNLNSEKLFGELFFFSPTSAQNRALKEISEDLKNPLPMLRLLQGDVGSGKTAVAAFICFLNALEKKQSAIMAPTEILAKQHFHTLEKVFSSHQIKVALLTGSTKAKQKKIITQEIASNNCLVIVGTHSLISEAIDFKNLSLVIIDEQHRFGVEQRMQLFAKGKKNGYSPHVLAMSATPIPRSLAMTIYGDFAISSLDELPPGRTTVNTNILIGNPTSLIPQLAHKILQKDEQGYIVYPLVEESEKVDLQNAKQAFSKLTTQFPTQPIALIHGKMKPAEKDLIMQDFALGKIKILISTTVIEVGIDVPNATNMVIVNAERFGLSQLHQLRGRVGRGSKPSNCYLLTQKLIPTDNAYHRLTLMEKTSDGFAIANADLALRGQGDFIGTRQSGLPFFRCLNFKQHADLIEPAQKLAITLAKRPKNLLDTI